MIREENVLATIDSDKHMSIFDSVAQNAISKNQQIEITSKGILLNIASKNPDKVVNSLRKIMINGNQENMVASATCLVLITNKIPDKMMPHIAKLMKDENMYVVGSVVAFLPMIAENVDLNKYDYVLKTLEEIRNGDDEILRKVATEVTEMIKEIEKKRDK